jgi:hypothetical protein
MLESNFWFDALRRLAPMAPVFLLWILGIIVAIARWRKHPGVSAAALAACLLAMLQVALSVAGTYWIQSRMENMMLWGGPQDVQAEVDRYVTLGSLLSSALNAFAWAFILMAAFGWRSHPGAFIAHMDRLPTLDDDERNARFRRETE